MNYIKKLLGWLEKSYDVDTIRSSDFCVEYWIHQEVYQNFENGEVQDEETTKQYWFQEFLKDQIEKQLLATSENEKIF